MGYIWVFPKIGKHPKMDGLQWKTLLKWMIWGYPYFRKHPYIYIKLRNIKNQHINPKLDQVDDLDYYSGFLLKVRGLQLKVSIFFQWNIYCTKVQKHQANLLADIIWVKCKTSGLISDYMIFSPPGFKDVNNLIRSSCVCCG